MNFKTVGGFLILFFLASGAMWFGYKYNIHRQGTSQTPSTRPVNSAIPEPNQAEIQISSPVENQIISSPLEISGDARGYWFFEASFPISLVDDQGNLIAQTLATAEDEWMTEELVPFTATLEFDLPTTQTGTIIFQKDNPSGLSENDRLFRLPIKFNVNPDLSSINLYYYNATADAQANNGNPSCNQDFVKPINQGVVQNPPNLEYAINSLLIADLTQEELTQGFTSEFPLDGVSLEEVNIENGVASLTFSDPQNQTTGGACRVGILRAQIEKTALQFSSVNQVEILPEEFFQP